ncbi:ammonium transporter [Streptomyces sp. NBC_01766]|uniref:ammonium transporter n=1 Tax=Streptomyces sp. NBC_01766 TaxID=2975936 RepID=UPI002DDA903A|nr:ammonium transporter [Streptomyces sp. NBC_01766]WSC22857.1 ammonium transporter [Streptomyces sp. NBC_01766]
MPPSYDSGDTAWLLVSTAMVLLMTPGLAFFYGGMVRTKHVLVMLKMSFACLCVVSVVWFALGYSLAFSGDVGGVGLIGDAQQGFLHGIGPKTLHGHIPTYVFATFQMAFAIITVALISGSIAGRARMSAWLVFAAVWTLVVYAPLAHWVFDPRGWVVHHLGALDFAGGLPVEINSGFAGLAVATVVRGRKDFRRLELRPNNVPLVALGLALLWFGWFGFNSGSALTDQGAAATALINTQLGAAGALITWPMVEKWRAGQVTMTGVCSGAVAGMVAITPACGEISPVGALVTGLVAGVVCAFAITLKYRFGVDDTLDVVGVHGWGGITGTFMVGLFATAQVSGRKGLFYGGGWDQLGKQVVAILACATFSFLATWLIAKAIDVTIGFSTPESYENVPGADEERAYDFRTVSQIADLTEDRPGAAGAGRAPAEVGAGRRAPSDAEVVERIRRLVKERNADR